nr:unnamed protein product [Spirometra erinaceieuropaei]
MQETSRRRRFRGEQRDTAHFTALAVLGCARRQHRRWFYDNDVTISNLLAEKNCLQKAYVNHPTNDNRASFYRSCRLVQQQLQHTWAALKTGEIQEYADRD